MNEEIHKALLAMGFFRGSELPPNDQVSYHHNSLPLRIDLPLFADWREVANALIDGGAEIQKTETKTLISAALRKLGFKL